MINQRIARYFNMTRRLPQVAIAVFFSLLLSQPAWAQSASLLPNAQQQFIGPTGAPYASGTIDMYVPNTSTRKSTWTTSSQATQNTNPIVLNAAGRATIYGVGSYRQVLKDANGLTVWDAVTTAPSTGTAAAATSGAGDFLALGTIVAIAGFTAPTNYLMTYGQAINRVTYSGAMDAITIVSSAGCTSASVNITGIADTSQMRIGAPIEASCLSPGTTVAAITGSTSINVSVAAVSSGTTTIRVFPWSNGDGSTTFNLPDLRGRVLPGADGIGGVVANRLTNTFYGAVATAPGVSGGAQSRAILQANLPIVTWPKTLAISDTRVFGVDYESKSIVDGASTPRSASALQSAPNATANAHVVSGSIGLTGDTTSGGLGTALATIQPSLTVNYAIKVLNGTLPTIGVLSLGGMTGDVLCGAGITCAGNTISTVTGNLTNNHIYVGNISNLATDVAMSGDCVIISTGVITCTKTNGSTFGSMALQAAGAVAITGGTITGMPAPAAASDVANKSYVDGLIQGLTIISQSRLTTAAVLPNTPTYANGAAGVGATLTAGANSTLTVDGTVAALNDVVLVKNQASSFQNGQYYVSAAGSGAAPWVLTRCTVANCTIKFDNAATMTKGSFTYTTTGVANLNTAWVLNASVATVGTDPAVFALYSVQNLTLANNNVFIGNSGSVATATPLGTNISSLLQTPTTTNLQLGALGIGTVGSFPLHVKSSNDTSYNTKMERQANDTAMFMGYRTAGLPVSAQNTFQFNLSYTSTGAFADITFNTSDVERMRVAANGNVGIGTAGAPSTTLDVNGNARVRGLTCAGFVGTDTSGNLICVPSSTAGGYYVRTTPDTTCTTDGSVDCTAVIQAQITACDAGKGGTVYLPAGILLVNNGLTLSKCSLRGAPWKLFQGLGTTFTIPDTGTFLKQTTTANSIITITGVGVQLTDLGFTQTQPADAGFPGPTAYPEVVLSNVGGATFTRVNLFGVTKGIRMGGADVVENISGSCFTFCLQAMTVAEVMWVRKTFFHAQIIGNTANIPNILSWIQNNSKALHWLRSDSPQFSDVFVFGFSEGFRFAGSGGTPTTRFKLTNFDCDSCVFGLRTSTTNGTFGHVANMSFTSNTGGGGGPIECNTTCTLDVSNLESLAAGTSTVLLASAGSDVAITNSRTTACNQTNAGWPAMYAIAGSTITLSGRYTFGAGFCGTSTAGGGTFNVGNVN